MTKLTALQRVLERRFTHFVDSDGPPSANHVPQREPVKPLRSFQLTPTTDSEFGACEKHETTVAHPYLNGSTLAFAVTLLDEDDFPEDEAVYVARAEGVAELFVPSTLFRDVASHLKSGTPDLETLRRRCAEPRNVERFVREMAIEFNQVSDADALAREALESEKALEKIVEGLKSTYYSSWNNSKDYEWIASLSDFTEEYVCQQYADLWGPTPKLNQRAALATDS